MLEAADGGQQMVYQAAVRAAVREEALCRTLLEQLQQELERDPPRREEFRLLYAQAEAGWLKAKKRVEKTRQQYESRLGGSR